MNRWSYVKRFGNVTYGDFMRCARDFCDAVNAEINSSVRITFYKKLPRSVSILLSDIDMKWLEESNELGELTKVLGIENVTEELFNQAVHVSLRIEPIDKDKAPKYMLGWLECKGVYNDRLVYNVQPAEVGKRVKALAHVRESELFFRFFWRIGDGFDHCHLVSMR